jgi:PKD repeat protein
MPHPRHTYDAAGSYVVTLLAANAVATDTAAGLVLAVPAPTAAFTYNVADLGVSFTNASAFANAFLWDFGDGSTSTERHPQHTYAAAGTYTVTLAATGPCGTAVAALPITVGGAPYRVFLPLVRRE